MSHSEKKHHHVLTRSLFALTAITLFGGCQSSQATDAQAALIEIEPTTTRAIEGISELERSKYFAIADDGQNFDRKVKDPAIYDTLVHDLNIQFGRSLGPVQSVHTWGKLVEEDPKRPGFADLDYLDEGLNRKDHSARERMSQDFGTNLDVAAHGHHNAYPEFMGTYTTEAAGEGDHPQAIPENLDAAVELALHVFKYNYTDLTRPAFFEAVNEPHWSFFGTQQLADWHLKLHEAFSVELPDVKVGGMCMSVAYMYDHNYRAWNGFSKFIDNTQGQLDFYSFHIYDYLDYQNDEFVGRIQSGLPLEGVLDMVPNYTAIHFGTPKPIVVSEHGGYVTGNQGKSNEEIAEDIANEYFPGEGFEWEIKKRSIMNFNHVSSILTNTMNFMEHPHTVLKAVPFILLESFAWDPKYYATLYSPENFNDKSSWVESRNMDFYRFFADLQGRRVKAFSNDADIQLQAFVDGSQLHIVLNNVGTQAKPLNLSLPPAKHYTVRRFGRHADFTPYLKDHTASNLYGMEIAGREAILITADYRQTVPERSRVNEVVHYGDRMIVEATGEDEATIHIPTEQTTLSNIDYATLRIGLRRPAGTDREIEVRFNGHNVAMPVEGSASRLENESDYATTRIARIEPKWIQANNRVEVSFPDGKGGTVGSAVLRTAVRED